MIAPQTTFKHDPTRNPDLKVLWHDDQIIVLDAKQLRPSVPCQHTTIVKTYELGGDDNGRTIDGDYHYRCANIECHIYVNVSLESEAPF